MLQINQLEYSIKEKTILNQINTAFLPGQLSLILGPNGAGKSTLIKILSGEIDKNYSGNIHFGNRSLLNSKPDEMAKIRAILSQNNLYETVLSVFDIVMLGRYTHSATISAQRNKDACNEAIAFVGMSNFANRSYDSLSGGEKQRVHFARVLAQIWYNEGHIRYLLMDEPLTYLDIRFQIELMQKISQFVKEQQIVALGVIHDLNIAAKFADNIILMNSGKIIAEGPNHFVLSKENIFKTFNIEPIFFANNGYSHIGF